MNASLTTKQQLFVEEYVVDFNATAARRKGGLGREHELRNQMRDQLDLSSRENATAIARIFGDAMVELRRLLQEEMRRTMDRFRADQVSAWSQQR